MLIKSIVRRILSVVAPLLQRRLVWMFVFLLSLVGIAGEPPKRVVVPPPLTMLQIRQAALDGDAVAQYKFGLSYQSHHDLGNAFLWFRKAARQGVGEAQHEVGKLLLEGAPGISKNPEDGVQWLLLAANQNVVGAQMGLGNWYEDNQTTWVDAFKWFSMAARSNRLSQVNVDTMILKMSAEEIEEGQKLVKEFKPSAPVKVALGFQLQGLMGSGENQFALINGKAFKENESGAIKVDDEMVNIECMELSADSAWITVEGEGEPFLLTLETK